jgi:hypothetical protein
MFIAERGNNRLNYCGLRIFDCGLRNKYNPKSEIRNPK